MNIFRSPLEIPYMLCDHLSHDYILYEKSIRKRFHRVGAVVFWNSFSVNQSFGKYKAKPDWAEGGA